MVRWESQQAQDIDLPPVQGWMYRRKLEFQIQKRLVFDVLFILYSIESMGSSPELCAVLVGFRWEMH